MRSENLVYKQNRSDEKPLAKARKYNIDLRKESNTPPTERQCFFKVFTR